MPEKPIDQNPDFLSAQRSYERKEVEESPRKLELDELFVIASKEKYEAACKLIKEKVSELPIAFLRECLWDGYKLDDYKKIEKELREILE